MTDAAARIGTSVAFGAGPVILPGSRLTATLAVPVPWLGNASGGKPRSTARASSRAVRTS
jgi:hypothetical protein